MFQKYKDIDGDSNVFAYRVNMIPSSIDILFKEAKFMYRYEERTIGFDLFRQMIQAAKTGDGLNAFANQPIFRKQKLYTKIQLDDEALSFIKLGIDLE